MSIRLGFFWLSMTLADIICAFLATGVLQMRGVLGYAGWRWMFLIEVRGRIARHEPFPGDLSD